MLDRDQIEAPQFHASSASTTAPGASAPFDPFSPMAFALLPLRMSRGLFAHLDEQRRESGLLRHLRSKTTR